MNSKIVFFGSEDFSAISLRALLDAGYIVDAVVTNPDTKRGRKRLLTYPVVKDVAIEHGINVIQPKDKKELEEMLKPYADKQYVGVLVSYGMIIPGSVIQMFKPGIINVHPSLLPKYRGPSPIESAIINGDQETGVTLMQLSSRMDAGPVYAFSPLELTGKETQPDLYQTLGTLGAQMLVAALPSIIDGSIGPNAQDESQATYTELLTKNMGVLNTDQLSAVEAERRIRGYQNYPKTKLTVNGHTIQPLGSHIALDASSDELSVVFKDDSKLIIDELIAPSGKRISGESFLRGYGTN